jgi:hypothetical protein
MIQTHVKVALTTAISQDPAIQQNAAARFLSANSDEITRQIKTILEGEVRLIIASLSIEEINSNRDAFKTKVKDSLGDRMKGFYEERAKTKLIRRMPVLIRLDGRAFHTFTKGFAKPFNKRMMETMQETTLELCKNIHGCVFGYTQSDEITLILVDYQVN